MAKFELVSRFAGCDELLPKRGTASSAGYDLIIAEDAIVYPLNDADAVNNPGLNLSPLIDIFFNGDTTDSSRQALILEEVAEITSKCKTVTRPRLVSTGIKCKLAADEYLEIVPRSSTPLKYWLIVANSPGIIDADYYNNPDNEGEIFIQLINLFPAPIQLRKGDKIAQAIIRKYYVTEDDAASGMRTGGFGSTS